VVEEHGSGLAAEPPAVAGDKQTLEQIASSTLELADSSSEKRCAESQPMMETNDMQSASLQSAASNAVDSHVIEPLPETNRG